MTRQSPEDSTTTVLGATIGTMPRRSLSWDGRTRAA
ncbi:hypothetical protein H4W33_009179 [Kibdelosporangium phytohabitans]|nr:hypothetical protein [Kibdelosporangium phytohabitans]